MTVPAKSPNVLTAVQSFLLKHFRKGDEACSNDEWRKSSLGDGGDGIKPQSKERQRLREKPSSRSVPTLNLARIETLKREARGIFSLRCVEKRRDDSFP